MKIIGCIPARYGSTRLPAKPLAEICGKPLILHVVERAVQAKKLHEVVVLTDDQRIFEVVHKAGFKVVMTNPACRNGTERIIDFLPQSNGDIFVNMQGDELLLNPLHVDQLVSEFVQGHYAMGTLGHWVSDEAVMRDPTTAKIVTDQAQNVLYFSRGAIPVQQNGQPPKQALIQIGIYIYQRATLQKIAELPPSPLEQIEQLEQLRALENKIPIHVTIVNHYEGFSIDTPRDLARACQLLR